VKSPEIVTHIILARAFFADPLDPPDFHENLLE
jgi:hypothetical protein